MKISVKKRVPEFAPGEYGAIITGVILVNKPGVLWSDPTPQLEMSYEIENGKKMVDWMPVTGYARYEGLKDKTGLRKAGEYAVDENGVRLVDPGRTKECTDRISDMIACAGFPDGADVEMGELVGRKIILNIEHTPNGKYFVKYFKRY